MVAQPRFVLLPAWRYLSFIVFPPFFFSLRTKLNDFKLTPQDKQLNHPTKAVGKRGLCSKLILSYTQAVLGKCVCMCSRACTCPSARVCVCHNNAFVYMSGHAGVPTCLFIARVNVRVGLSVSLSRACLVSGRAIQTWGKRTKTRGMVWAALGRREQIY